MIRMFAIAADEQDGYPGWKLCKQLVIPPHTGNRLASPIRETYKREETVPNVKQTKRFIEY